MSRDRIDLRKGHKRGPISDNIPIESDSDIFHENLATMVERVTLEHQRLAKADSEFLKNIAKGSGKYRKTVVSVVYKDDEFLLVKKPHWKGWLDFPQEGINKGESLKDALVRGLYEELGTKNFGIPINTNIRHKREFSKETLNHYTERGYIGKSLYYFIIEYLGRKKDIILGDDLCDKKWCDKKTLIDLLYKPEIKVAKQVLKFMKDNSYR